MIRRKTSMEQQLNQVYAILARVNEIFIEENGLRKQKELKHIETQGIKGKTGLFVRAFITAVVFLVNFFNIGLALEGTGNIIVAIIILLITSYALLTFLKPRKNKDKKRDKKVKIILIIAIIMAVHTMRNVFSHAPVWGIVFIVGALGIAAVFTSIYIKKDQSTVNSTNEGIRADNAAVQARRDELSAEYQKLAQLLQIEVENGYPENYTNMDAVTFFMNAYKNGRGATYGELINLYEDAAYKARQEQKMAALEKGQKKMLMTQQEILKQQNLNNMFNIIHTMQLSQISNNQTQMIAQNATKNRELQSLNGLVKENNTLGKERNMRLGRIDDTLRGR